LIRPEFLREWLDPSGNAQKHRYEIPIDVIPSGKSVQIRFPNHQRLWTDLKELQSNKRIESWAPHEKRISAIAWGTKNPELFTFSEDHSVKRLVVPTSRDRIIQTDGTAIFPLAANRCVIQTDGDPTYSMLEIGSEPIHTTDASSLLSDTIVYSQPFLQRDSLLIAKLAGTDPGGQRWSVDRWEASGKRSESIAKFPEDIWVELFFGSPLPERWLGRFCVWNGKSHQDQKSVFYGLWNSKESKFDWRTDENDEPFRHPDISRDGRYLIFESGSKISRVSTLDGTKITLVDLPGQSISCMKYSPDGKYIAVALTKPSAIHNYRASDGKLIWEIHPQGRPIEDLSWSMDQQILVSLSLDGYLRTYDVVTQKISSQQLLPISNPKQLRLSLDEQSLFVLGGQGEILPILLPPTGESTKQR
jgi:WD40 repeat protein